MADSKQSNKSRGRCFKIEQSCLPDHVMSGGMDSKSIELQVGLGHKGRSQARQEGQWTYRIVTGQIVKISGQIGRSQAKLAGPSPVWKVSGQTGRSQASQECSTPHRKVTGQSGR